MLKLYRQKEFKGELYGKNKNKIRMSGMWI